MIRDRICKKCLKYVPFRGTTFYGEVCTCKNPDIKSEEEIYTKKYLIHGMRMKNGIK